jgi:hypothetical protein
MEKQHLHFARVTSKHFDNVFDKSNDIHTKDEVCELINKMFDDVDEKDEKVDYVTKRQNIVKTFDFLIGYCKENGVSGSELFSLILSKDKININN